MILSDFKDFPRVGRIIGVDWGARRVGVAVSDETRDLVFTRPVIQTPRGTDAAPEIATIARDVRAVGIVIGLPMHADGTESETSACVREFAARVAQNIDLPICLIDESFTSITAQSQMGRVRRDDIKRELDSASARVILENAIAIVRRI